MCAGKSNTSGCSNTFLGYQSGNTNTTGCCNVAIGRDVELPSATGNLQFAIGDGTNRWITGDSDFKIYDKDGNEITGGGGGGGAPEFYTGITSSVQVAPLSYETTILPSHQHRVDNMLLSRLMLQMLMPLLV